MSLKIAIISSIILGSTLAGAHAADESMNYIVTNNLKASQNNNINYTNFNVHNDSDGPLLFKIRAGRMSWQECAHAGRKRCEPVGLHKGFISNAYLNCVDLEYKSCRALE